METFIVGMLKCSNGHGISMNALPLFQYSLDSSYLNMTKAENKITWSSPKIWLGTKMAHYKTHFLHTSEDGFIIRPPYMDIHLSYTLRNVIGQLRTLSHQLEIEVGRYTWIPLEERICQLCHQGVESEEHYLCHCSVFYEIRGRYHLPI